MTYTINGYISALTLRTKRTLLTECRTDKTFSSRMLLELQQLGRLSSSIVIDTVELIKSDPETRGNRVLVETIHNKAVDENISITSLVDREYRYFNLEDFSDTLEGHNSTPTHLYWTRGHSLENYFFKPDFFINFIKLKFSENLLNDSLKSIFNHFSSILRWATAISLILNRHNLLSKSEGIANYRMWSLVGKDVMFNHSLFTNDLTTRGVTADLGKTISIQIDSLEKIFTENNTSQELLQWLCHGHLGWSLLWTGVAAVLAQHVSQIDIIEQVERGYNELKLESSYDFAASLINQNHNQILDDLWQHLIK